MGKTRAETAERPPGGHRFEVVRMIPDGWVCLAPWVTTPDGFWWRPHVFTGTHERRYSDDAQEWCEHLAAQLNAGMRREDDDA